jgi:hypothetical protein
LFTTNAEFNTEFEILCADLETLTWRSIIICKNDQLDKITFIDVDQSELIVHFMENNENLPDTVYAYSCLLFPIG